MFEHHFRRKHWRFKEQVSGINPVPNTPPRQTPRWQNLLPPAYNPSPFDCSFFRGTDVYVDWMTRSYSLELSYVLIRFFVLKLIRGFLSTKYVKSQSGQNGQTENNILRWHGDNRSSTEQKYLRWAKWSVGFLLGRKLVLSCHWHKVGKTVVISAIKTAQSLIEIWFFMVINS